jgi:multiple sugar transport system permease protein
MIHNKYLKAGLYYTFITVIAVIIALPFIWMVLTAFKSQNELMLIPIQWLPERLSIKSFQKLFRIFPYTQAMWNSIFVAVLTTLITLTSASMAAYVFAKFNFKGRDKLFILFLATMMIPGQATMIPNYLVLKYLGLLNTFTGLMLPSLFNAFGVFLLRQNIKGISDSYIEAAVIDGASHFTIFTRVIIPLVKPVLATLGVLTFMGSWNAFLWPLIVLTDKSKMTLPVGLNLLNGQYGSDYNMLMAGSLLSVIPIILIYLLAQNYFEQGLSVGGIKQ